MRFSDSTHIQLPQPTRYANSDSSPFNSDESVSDETDEDPSQTFMTPSTTSTSFSTSNQNVSQDFPHANKTPLIPSNYNLSIVPTNDTSVYKDIINTPHTSTPIDRSRHPSHNQTDSLPPRIDRTAKTTYKLRHQPKLDYRLFIPPSKL